MRYMKCYYGHSMRIYGTWREKRELWYLRLRGYRVCNPNGQLERRAWKAQAHSLIDKCNVFIFSEYRAHMGRGVTEEIAMALDMHKPVYVLRDWRLHPVTNENVTVLNIDWAVQFARLLLTTALR